MLKPNGHIINPQMLGGDTFHIGKDLAGNHVFTINGQSISMNPRQTHDLAVRLLASLGFHMEKVEQQSAALPGQKLAG